MSKPIPKEVDNSTMEEKMNAVVVDYYLSLGSRMNKKDIEISKIKQHESGYLVLAMYHGEGPMLSLFHVKENEKDEYEIIQVSSGQLAISMGFAVNRLVYNNNTILFSNLNKSTWIPETDTRKPTDYIRVLVESNRGTRVEESVEGDTGYIIILNSDEKIGNMVFYNAAGEVVSTMLDMGKAEDTVNETRFETVNKKM